MVRIFYSFIKNFISLQSACKDPHVISQFKRKKDNILCKTKKIHFFQSNNEFKTYISQPYGKLLAPLADSSISDYFGVFDKKLIRNKIQHHFLSQLRLKARSCCNCAFLYRPLISLPIAAASTLKRVLACASCPLAPVITKFFTGHCSRAEVLFAKNI